MTNASRLFDAAATILYKAAWYAAGCGRYEPAEVMDWESLEARTLVLGKEHPYALRSTNNLATVMSSRAKYERAEEMHREALKLRETVLSKEHPSTLTSMDNLPLVLKHQGSLAHPFCSQNRFEQALTLSESLV